MKTAMWIILAVLEIPAAIALGVMFVRAAREAKKRNEEENDG